MLSEGKPASLGSPWKVVKKDFHHDPRYKAVEGSKHREELFRQYLESLVREKVCSLSLVILLQIVPAHQWYISKGLVVPSLLELQRR